LLPDFRPSGTIKSSVDLAVANRKQQYSSTQMKRSPEIVRLGKEICSRLDPLKAPSTAAVRTIRREFSHRVANATPENIIHLALHLLQESSDLLRFFSYELVSKHRLASEQLTPDDLLNLGKGLNSWSSVDCFAMYLSGLMWVRGRLSDKTILTWARSEDRWWRRTALVSTVALSRGGDPGDVPRVAHICTVLVADRDDRS
jgi:3-methyladenine DNA glycosylase AlkD